MKKKTSRKPKKKERQPAAAVKRSAAPAEPFWKQHWLPAVLLFGLPFLLYSASLSFGYVLDDKIVLSENSFVQQGLAGLRQIFTTESFTGYLGEQQDLVVGSRYRPLSIASFAVEFEIWGFNPWISHGINILCYALTGLLLFRVLAQLLPRAKSPWWLALPFLVSALFILHPVHTEVVANIKGRDEIFALLLSFGTLYYALRYEQRRKTSDLIGAGLAFFLALLAKENAVTFLAVIPLTLWLFKRARLPQLAWTLAPLTLAFGAYLALRINAIGYLLDSGQAVTGIMNNPFAGTTTGEKYATICYTLGDYLRLLVFPHPLTHDYYPYQVPIINWQDWRALLPLALYGGLGYLAIRTLRKQPIYSWSIWYYLLTLSIVSNLVFPVGAPMNERFLYMPSVGFCLALATVAAQWLPTIWPAKQRGYYLGVGLLALIGLGYAYKTITRVPDWRDEMALNRAAVQVSTNSARANSYMAYSLYRYGLEVPDNQEKRRVFEAALPYVNRALEIYPTYTDAITCKGGLVTGLYQLDGNLDRLLAEFHQLLSAGHVPFIDAYLEYLNPRADRATMTAFYHRTGYELIGVQQRNYPLSIQYLNYGLGIDANNVQLLEDLTAIYYAAGRYPEAIQTAQRGLQLRPDSPTLRQYLQEASRRE
jgi:tetratricopeptide (TPR) repeat protein